MYKIYALIKDSKCIYVGCTINLKNRLKSHKQIKEFDSSIIISYHEYKKDALLAERSIIKFLSIFGGDELLNSRYINLAYTAQIEKGLDCNLKNY